MEQVLYKLPDGWEWSNLTDVCTPSRKTVEPNPEEQYNYIGLENIESHTGKVISNSPTKGSEISSTKVSFKKGMVLYGKLRPYLNKVVVAKIDGIATTEIIPFECSDVISPDFLAYYLRSQYFVDLAMNNCSGARMPRATTKLFTQIAKVPVTSITEQKRIVEKLDALLTRIDTAIEHLQESVTLADALVKSSLSAMLTKQEHWDKVSLSDVCQITSKLCDPREEQYLDMFHIGGANIASFNGELIGLKTAREEKLISGKFPFDNSMVLYSKIRPYLMKVARPSFSGICSADIYPLTPDNQKMSRDFLFYLLLSDLFTQYAIEGSSRAGMPKVNRNHLFNFEFYLPPIDEQKSICESLDALVEKTNEVSKELTGKLSYLAGLKASILDSAFKGEL
ncbi:restriction endonuclease subunit S [Vibrio sp. Vb1337]|uniref:restriction endonuclease subunit S n=1 Tax=Vibrio sp. Vb1337 TaxID=3074641 RepID=UPI002963E4CE|nr:restriction endonuclease subunit S [Vibrio sp. Vb1337]MDW1901298.1 restriction endonuclease subunit S [Vibrio sp. Vb1337]